jgi:hypothetical protein
MYFWTQLELPDQRTPFFIYAGAGAQKHKREAVERGAQGSTNRPQELLDIVVQALPEANVA